VKTLDYVGIYDDPSTPQQDGLVGTASRLGITSLTRQDYGLSLTLGGGEVSLLELTSAYAVLANGGRRLSPIAITRIEDFEGKLVYEYQPPTGEQVARGEHAYILSSILSDNAARTPMFGPNSVLNLPFSAAVKTGTTNDFRDNWTLGYTPDIAIGVWVGNPDYTPMKNTTGLSGAAPIWAEVMEASIQQLTGGNPTAFARPAGIVDRVICAISGSEPSQWCPGQRSEIFASDQPPLPKEKDLWGKILLDTWTGLRASEACADFTHDEFVLNVTDPWAIGWIQNEAAGKEWALQQGFQEPIRFAPERECQADDPRPLLQITNLVEGQTISTFPLEIIGRVDASANFRDYILDYGIGTDPVEWFRLEQSDQPVSHPGKIYTWESEDIPTGIITLRIRMRSIRDTSAVLRVHINLQVPTSTPTPTATSSPTPTSIPTLPWTATPSPTLTLPPPATPTSTLVPTLTETPGPSPTLPNNP
jgi:membrane peptidoglycan carboxypeptidase